MPDPMSDSAEPKPSSDLWSIKPRRLLKWAGPLLGIGLIVIPLSANINAIRSYYYVSRLDRGWNASYQAEQMLRSIGPKAIPALKRGLKDPVPKVRIDCIEILRDLRGQSWRTVPYIIPLTEDPDPRVQVEARFAICRLREPADLVEPLIRQWIQEKKLAGDNRAIQTIINLPPDGLPKSVYISFCLRSVRYPKTYSSHLSDVAAYGVLNTVKKDKGELTREEKTAALKTLLEKVPKRIRLKTLRRQAQQLLEKIAQPF